MQVYCAYTRMVPIEDLRPNPKNPNRHPAEQIRLLAKIMKEQGWRAPITVSNRSGYIVRGHGRLLAAAEAGFSECPVDFQDYDSDEAEKADLLADNRISELSANDDDALAELLEELQGADFDLELAGYCMDDAEEVEEAVKATEIDDAVACEQAGRVKFASYIDETSQYVVLKFNRKADWLQAQSVLGLEKVMALPTRNDGQVNDNFTFTGLGRVVDGVEAFKLIADNAQALASGEVEEEW